MKDPIAEYHLTNRHGVDFHEWVQEGKDQALALLRDLPGFAYRAWRFCFANGVALAEAERRLRGAGWAGQFVFDGWDGETEYTVLRDLSGPDGWSWALDWYDWDFQRGEWAFHHRSAYHTNNDNQGLWLGERQIEGTAQFALPRDAARARRMIASRWSIDHAS